MATSASLVAKEAEESIYFFSADDAKESIRKTGAFVVEDARAGQRVNEFLNLTPLPLRKPDGLDFCARNSLYDKNVREVIESVIAQPHYGFAKAYDSQILASNRTYFFLKGPEIRGVYILLFTPSTRLDVFEGSHTKEIEGKVAMSGFGIMTLPHDRLETEGIKRVSHNLSRGGFALIDGRVGWTLLEGRQLVIGYASKVEINEWGLVALGDTNLLRKKVEELNDRGIRTNFIFVKPQTDVASK